MDYNRRKKIDCKPELVISSLQKFYTNREDIERILPYLQGTADLSLRLIDWFVTNYCRRYFVSYPLNGQEFLVYVSYKSQLKAYSKQYFDPNCRRERILFQIPGNEPFLTTVGKLNFFRWAIETQLLDYIDEHIEEIQKERAEAIKESGKARRESGTESSTGSTDTILTVSTDVSTDSASSDNTSATWDFTTAAMPQVSGTRRRRSKQIPAATRRLQRHDAPIIVTFE
jgi:hypothetical protein